MSCIRCPDLLFCLHAVFLAGKALTVSALPKARAAKGEHEVCCSEVYIPDGVSCCGFAGDKGMTNRTPDKLGSPIQVDHISCESVCFRKIEGSELLADIVSVAVLAVA